MGGGIALAFALNYPGQTAGLALIASSAKLRVAPQLLDLAQNDFERAVDLVTQWEWGPLAPDAVKQLGKQQLLATNPTVMLNDYRACDAFDKRERLTEIYVPTLIIAGEVDAMTPFKHAQFMVERLPQARLVSVAQAGHMVMLEAETKVTLVMTQFVRDVLITATNNV
jgi:pimeloyl-ACP methyl ester carboxylesterase